MPAGEKHASEHRLGTVKLSQALSTQAPKLATNFSEIDLLLDGGLSAGLITEVYGCPGAGKTAFAASLAARVIKNGDCVIWLEASQTLPSSRLLDFAGSEDFSQEDEEKLLRLVQVLQIPTLTSLLAFLATLSSSKTGQNFGVSESTRLLVLDDLTTIYNAAFPADSSRETNSKKATVLTLLASKLSRLAAQHNLVVLVLCKLTSKISRGGPAQLEGPFGDAWSTACSTRLLLYRDSPTRRLTPGDESALRWVTAQRVKNKNILDPEAFSFKITGTGIEEMPLGADLSRSQSRLSQASSVTLDPAIDLVETGPAHHAVRVGQKERYDEEDEGADKEDEEQPIGPSKRARYV